MVKLGELTSQVRPACVNINLVDGASRANSISRGRGPGFCGEVLVIKYTKVVIDGCPDVDLAGAISTENVVSDHGRGSPERFRPDQGGILTVTTGNDITGGDRYSFCAPITFMPRDDCTETYTQTQFIDGTICRKTVTIAFSLHRTASGCSGSATRNP